MKLLKRNSGGTALATQLRTDSGLRFGGLGNQIALGGGEAMLYRGMRRSIPILDAAVEKLIRLVGGFEVICRDKRAQGAMEEFIRTVPVGRGQVGLESFLTGYLDSMLTSELWAIRRAVTPVLEKICRMYLALAGYGEGATVQWQEISLQDMVEEAKTALYHAQAEKTRKETGDEDQ